MRARRISREVAPVAVVCCAVALAACGSSAGSGSTAAASPLLKFAQCMRAHGVPKFPDPSPAGGIEIGPSMGIKVQDPAVRSAQRACQKLMPGGGPMGGPPSESAKLAMLNLATCMRRHGLTGFPDPTLSPPPPGSGTVIGRDGVFLVLGHGLSPRSPAFRQAAAACGFGLPGGKPSPAAGTSS